MYLSADLNVGPFKGWFSLCCMLNIMKRNEVVETIWLVNMLILFLLTFWYVTMQYRKGELRWVFFVYMFFKTNYIWILLQCVTFHIQVEISIYIVYEIIILRHVYSNRVWIECAELWVLLLYKKKLCFIYLWIQYKNKKYKRKERSVRSIDPLKLINRV